MHFAKPISCTIFAVSIKIINKWSQTSSSSLMLMLCMTCSCSNREAEAEDIPEDIALAEGMVCNNRASRKRRTRGSAMKIHDVCIVFIEKSYSAQPSAQ